MAIKPDNITTNRARQRNRPESVIEPKTTIPQSKGRKQPKVVVSSSVKTRRLPAKRGNDETASEVIRFPRDRVNWNIHIDISFAFDNLSVISEGSKASELDISDSEYSDASEEGTLKRKRLKKLLQCNILPEAAEKYKRDYTLHELTVSSRVVANEIVGRELSLKVTDDMMLSSGKLVLLLDLDNTLLHAISQSKLNYELKLDDYLDDLGDPELYTFTLPNYAEVSYYLKLRPRLREFLHILSFYYEMSIYTNATREYADVVIAILDPDRSLFMDRIIARGGSNDRDLTKSARRLYPKLSQRFVVSFDDRRDVWTDIDPNQVLKAHHYAYFMENLSQNIGNYINNNNVIKPSDSANSTKPNVNGLTLDLSQSCISDSNTSNGVGNSTLYDYDMHLMYMTKVFLELHKRFYANPLTANVGTILAEMQKETLNNVGIFFTGFRKNVKNAPSGWTDCEVRQKEMALEFGARVVDKLTDKKTSHVVAAKNCTDNLIKSREPEFDHLHKVHFLWLYSCRATWQKIPCDKFDVDAVCSIYSNTPPLYPGKDHWKCLYDPKIHGSLTPTITPNTITGCGFFSSNGSSTLGATLAATLNATNDKATNEKFLTRVAATNEKASNEKATNEKATNEKATNEKTTSEKTTNEKATNERRKATGLENAGRKTKSMASTKASRGGANALPLRVFLGTGQYSHDTLIISPTEKILIKWDPSATKPRQFERGDAGEGSKRLAGGEATPYCDATSLPDPLLSELYS